MRICLIVAHYFKAEANPAYSSVDARKRDQRRQALARVLMAWRAQFSESSSLDIGQKMTELHPTSVALDMSVLVQGEDHLVDEHLQRGLGVELVGTQLANPRMLPFGAHQLMAERRGQYDWFVYSEDDLLLHDPALFQKIAAFNRVFGPRRLLQPNRYELNPQAWRLKTYIDGDLRPGLVDGLWSLVDDPQSALVHESDFGLLHFARARNPHSGFFALSSEQLAYWMAQPHFGDQDCSFVSPLESAATLCLAKTFSIYKPSAPNHNHLEIEHLDNKFSNLRLPIMYRGG